MRLETSSAVKTPATLSLGGETTVRRRNPGIVFLTLAAELGIRRLAARADWMLQRTFASFRKVIVRVSMRRIRSRLLKSPSLATRLMLMQSYFAEISNGLCMICFSYGVSTWLVCAVSFWLIAGCTSRKILWIRDMLIYMNWLNRDKSLSAIESYSSLMVKIVFAHPRFRCARERRCQYYKDVSHLFLNSLSIYV